MKSIKAIWAHWTSRSEHNPPPLTHRGAALAEVDVQLTHKAGKVSFLSQLLVPIKSWNPDDDDQSLNFYFQQFFTIVKWAYNNTVVAHLTTDNKLIQF